MTGYSSGIGLGRVADISGSYHLEARTEMPGAAISTDRTDYAPLTDAHLTSVRLDRHRAAVAPWLMPH